MMGWDITDFGSGNFDEIGCVLYTVRNGLITDASVGVPYCEKYLLFKEGSAFPSTTTYIRARTSSTGRGASWR